MTCVTFMPVFYAAVFLKYIYCWLVIFVFVEAAGIDCI